MKNFIFLTLVSFLFLIITFNKIFAQWGTGPELVIDNRSGSFGGNIDIKFFPVGAVYNWDELYSPKIAGTPLPNNGPIYLVGFNKTLHNTNDSTRLVFGQFDDGDQSISMRIRIWVRIV